MEMLLLIGGILFLIFSKKNTTVQSMSLDNTVANELVYQAAADVANNRPPDKRIPEQPPLRQGSGIASTDTKSSDAKNDIPINEDSPVAAHLTLIAQTVAESNEDPQYGNNASIADNLPESMAAYLKSVEIRNQVRVLPDGQITRRPL